MFYDLDEADIAAIRESLMFTKNWLHDSVYYGGSNEDLMVTLEKINNAYTKLRGDGDGRKDSE